MVAAGVRILHKAGKPGRVLAPTADLLQAAGWRSWREQQRARRHAASWTPEVRRAVYHHLWTDAARHHGAEVGQLSGDFLLIRRGSRSTLVWYHTVMLDYGVSLVLASDKVATHRLLADVGVPSAAHVHCDVDDLAAAAGFLAELDGRPVVVKPAASTSGGEGVTCGVRNLAELERARSWAGRWDRRLLVEEQALGEELRFLYLDGELLDVLRRRPPSVVGDGTSTVSELVTVENARREAAGGWAGTPFLSVDLDCVLTLERDGLTLGSVPLAGRAVQVKTAANENNASENETVRPEELSPELLRDAAAAAAASGLRLAGVEIITPDQTRGLRAAGGLVVEVNGTPGLHYHYLVARPEAAVPVARPLLAVLLDPDRSRGFQPAGDRW
jgi:D-alanine-D-alanine ligase-like ATP-grasp enzyme